MLCNLKLAQYTETYENDSREAGLLITRDVNRIISARHIICDRIIKAPYTYVSISLDLYLSQSLRNK